MRRKASHRDQSNERDGRRDEGQVAVTAWDERMEMGAAKISIYSEGGNERAEGGFDATLSSTRERGREAQSHSQPKTLCHKSVAHIG